jgi:hypothetical protein
MTSLSAWFCQVITGKVTLQECLMDSRIAISVSRNALDANQLMPLLLMILLPVAMTPSPTLALTGSSLSLSSFMLVPLPALLTLPVFLLWLLGIWRS